MPDEVEVFSAHHERAVVGVGDVVLKVDSDPHHLDVEVEAMRLATGIPTPDVRWHHPPVLALARLPGRPLALPGEPVRTSPAAWAAAGELVRRLHALPLPPWPGWRLPDDARVYVAACERVIVDRRLVEPSSVARVVAMVEPALRPVSPVFTHGDLQPAHVFVDGDAVTGVIDWSDACRGDALFDLAVLTVGFEERLDDVLRGYGDAGDVDREVIRGWWALRRLAGVRWMAEHGFDPSGDVAALVASAGQG